MKFKKLVQELTPPIILRGAIGALHLTRGMGLYTFKGHYPTLRDVPLKDGYNDKWLAEQIVASNVNLVRSMAPNKKTTDATGALITPQIVAQLIQNGPLSLIDFGGGFATCLINIFEHCPELDYSKLTYYVVETPIFCEAARPFIDKAYSDRLGLPFHIEMLTEIPKKISGPLVVNMGGVLQYLENYKATIQHIIKLNPSHIVIGQTSASDHPTYARLQTNMPHKRHLAAWVFQRREIIEMLSGYRLVFSVDHDLPLTHSGAPGPWVMASMVFVPCQPL